MIEQSVFEGLDEKWKWAAADKSGMVAVYTHMPEAGDGSWLVGSKKGRGWQWVQQSVPVPEYGLSDDEWQGSLTKRVVNMAPPEPAPWEVFIPPIPTTPPQFGGEFDPAPVPQGPTISDMVERGLLVDPVKLRESELLCEAERAKAKLQKARKRAAAAVAEGAMSMEVFAEIFR